MKVLNFNFNLILINAIYNYLNFFKKKPNI